MASLSKKERKELNITYLQFAEKNTDELMHDADNIAAIISVALGYSSSAIIATHNMLYDCGAITSHREPKEDHNYECFLFPQLTAKGHKMLNEGINIDLWLQEKQEFRKQK